MILSDFLVYCRGPDGMRCTGDQASSLYTPGRPSAHQSCSDRRQGNIPGYLGLINCTALSEFLFDKWNLSVHKCMTVNLNTLLSFKAQ